MHQAFDRRFFVKALIALFIIQCCLLFSSDAEEEQSLGSKFASQAASNAPWIDRLKMFYSKIADPSTGVKSCKDRSMLMPKCTECIPGRSHTYKHADKHTYKHTYIGTKGTQASKTGGSCDEFIKGTKDIREEIGILTKQRFGTNLPPDREFGLYPCK